MTTAVTEPTTSGTGFGTIITAVPALTDPINFLVDETVEGGPHATILWFGKDLTDEQAGILTSETARIAALLEPVTVDVTGVTQLGEDTPPATVALLDPGPLGLVRAALLGDPMIHEVWGNIPQKWPTYKPHVTLSYGGPLYDATDLGPIRFDRVAVWHAGTHVEFPLGPVVETKAAVVHRVGGFAAGFAHFDVRFDPLLHPRDYRGRFIDTPDVTLPDGSPGVAVSENAHGVVTVAKPDGSVASLPVRELREPQHVGTHTQTNLLAPNVTGETFGQAPGAWTMLADLTSPNQVTTRTWQPDPDFPERATMEPRPGDRIVVDLGLNYQHRDEWGWQARAVPPEGSTTSSASGNAPTQDQAKTDAINGYTTLLDRQIAEVQAEEARRKAIADKRDGKQQPLDTTPSGEHSMYRGIIVAAHGQPFDPTNDQDVLAKLRHGDDWPPFGAYWTTDYRIGEDFSVGECNLSYVWSLGATPQDPVYGVVLEAQSAQDLVPSTSPFVYEAEHAVNGPDRTKTSRILAHLYRMEPGEVPRQRTYLRTVEVPGDQWAKPVSPALTAPNVVGPSPSVTSPPFQPDPNAPIAARMTALAPFRLAHPEYQRAVADNLSRAIGAAQKGEQDTTNQWLTRAETAALGKPLRTQLDPFEQETLDGFIKGLDRVLPDWAKAPTDRPTPFPAPDPAQFMAPEPRPNDWTIVEPSGYPYALHFDRERQRVTARMTVDGKIDNKTNTTNMAVTYPGILTWPGSTPQAWVEPIHRDGGLADAMLAFAQAKTDTGTVKYPQGTLAETGQVVTADHTATPGPLITWSRAEDDFGLPIQVANTPAGRYEVSGNGAGRMRWYVRYPDGNVGITTTRREARAWAEDDLARWRVDHNYDPTLPTTYAPSKQGTPAFTDAPADGPVTPDLKVDANDPNVAIYTTPYGTPVRLTYIRLTDPPGGKVWAGIGPDDRGTGYLQWTRSGEILMVDVSYSHRREGIATAMLAWARRHEPNVHHSDILSDDGRLWSMARPNMIDQPAPAEKAYYGTDDAPTFTSRLTRCYELSARAIVDLSMPDGATLVHGSISQGTPPLGHGWVRLPDGRVWEPITRQTFDPDEWAAFANPTVDREYDKQAAIDHMLRYGHYGPWHRVDERNLADPNGRLIDYHDDQPIESHVPHTDGSPTGAGTVDDPVNVNGDLDRAVQLLAQGKHVRLNQPDEVSVLLDKLAEAVAEATRTGAPTPVIDLCKVTVPGTNLFCAEHQGVPRAAMPQLGGKPLPGSIAAGYPGDHRGVVDMIDPFMDAMTDRGVTNHVDFLPLAHLRSTQSELDGAKVADIVARIDAGNYRQGDIPLVVTRDGYILDGHHRWAARVSIDARDGTFDDSMPVRVLGMDIGEALDAAREFTDKVGLPSQKFPFPDDLTKPIRIADIPVEAFPDTPQPVGRFGRTGTPITYRTQDGTLSAVKIGDNLYAECGRCNPPRSGSVSYYAHVYEGVCFECGGKGYTTSLGSETEVARRIRTRGQAQRRAAAKRAAQQAEHAAQGEAWRKDHPDLVTALAPYAGDGSPLGEWADRVNAGGGFTDAQTQAMRDGLALRERADEAAAVKAAKARWGGSVGDKTTITGTVKVAKYLEPAQRGWSGSMFIVVEGTGPDEGITVKVIGSSASLYGLRSGDPVSMSGTIKALDTYQDTPQTVLTRAKATIGPELTQPLVLPPDNPFRVAWDAAVEWFMGATADLFETPTGTPVAVREVTPTLGGVHHPPPVVPGTRAEVRRVYQPPGVLTSTPPESHTFDHLREIAGHLAANEDDHLVAPGPLVAAFTTAVDPEMVRRITQEGQDWPLDTRVAINAGTPSVRVDIADGKVILNLGVASGDDFYYAGVTHVLPIPPGTSETGLADTLRTKLAVLGLPWRVHRADGTRWPDAEGTPEPQQVARRPSDPTLMGVGERARADLPHPSVFLGTTEDWVRDYKRARVQAIKDRVQATQAPLVPGGDNLPDTPEGDQIRVRLMGLEPRQRAAILADYGQPTPVAVYSIPPLVLTAFHQAGLAPGPGAVAGYEVFSDRLRHLPDGTRLPVWGLHHQGITIDGTFVKDNGVPMVVEHEPGSSVPDRVAWLRSAWDLATQGMPPHITTLTQGLVFTAQPFPGDSPWSGRTAATAGDGTLTVWNFPPDPGLLLHEMAHNVDMDLTPGHPTHEDPAWILAVHADTQDWDENDRGDVFSATQGFFGADHPIIGGGHAVTQYGESADTEDFAESVYLYWVDKILGRIGTDQNDVVVRFADLWPHRATHLDTLLGPTQPPVNPEKARGQLDALGLPTMHMSDDRVLALAGLPVVDVVPRLAPLEQEGALGVPVPDGIDPATLNRVLISLIRIRQSMSSQSDDQIRANLAQYTGVTAESLANLSRSSLIANIVRLARNQLGFA